MSVRRTVRLFFAAGLVMLGAAAFFLGKTLLLVNRASTAQGTVVGYDSRGSSDGEFPIVQFHTGRGERIQFVSQTGSFPPPDYVGATVKVMHDPSDPAG